MIDELVTLAKKYRDANDDLAGLVQFAKSIATDSEPAIISNVRSFKRINMAKQQATRVNSFKRRRFKNPGAGSAAPPIGE
jgi:hypothetical protein